MKRILLLEGGFNEEHEISLKTSLEVQKSLREMKLNFDVIKSKLVKWVNNNY